MNKNIKKLADNPHYTMSEKELDKLAAMLREEALANKEDDETPIVLEGINKNRVHKTFVKLNKTKGLKEDEYGSPRQ